MDTVAEQHPRTRLARRSSILVIARLWMRGRFPQRSTKPARMLPLPVVTPRPGINIREIKRSAASHSRMLIAGNAVSVPGFEPRYGVSIEVSQQDSSGRNASLIQRIPSLINRNDIEAHDRDSAYCRWRAVRNRLEPCSTSLRCLWRSTVSSGSVNLVRASIADLDKGKAIVVLHDEIDFSAAAAEVARDGAQALVEEVADTRCRSARAALELHGLAIPRCLVGGVRCHDFAVIGDVLDRAADVLRDPVKPRLRRPGTVPTPAAGGRDHVRDRGTAFR